MRAATAGRLLLVYLAARQATEVNAFMDSAPGKIMHETRGGEMSALGEVPFGLYYGGVDTTCLFIALAGAYAKRTNDYGTIRALWPHLIAAAGWALREPLAALSASYGSQFALKGLDALHSGMVLLGTVLLGWLGARVVTGHFLRQTRPTET